MDEILAIAQYGSNWNTEGVQEAHELAEALRILTGAVGDDSEFAIAAIDLGYQEQVGDTA